MIAGGWLALPDPSQREKLQRDLGRRLAKMLRKNPDRIAPLSLVERGDVADAARDPDASKEAPS